MYYIYNGRIENTNKKAIELYDEWIKKSDGYSNDQLQREDNHTIVFTLVDYTSWLEYPFDLRFEESITTGRIEKSFFKKASEVLADILDFSCFE